MSRISVSKKPSQAKESGVVVGGGTRKITKTNASVKSLNISNKWSMIAAFALMFGGIGSWLLFASHADQAAQNGYIFVGNYSVSPTGTDVMSNNLPADAHQGGANITVSRDGQHIAYSKPTTNQIISYATATPATQGSFLLPATSSQAYIQQIRWSPDDTWIAVDYNDTQGNHVYVSHPDGSGGVSVTASDDNGNEPGLVDWLSDSKTLAYFTTASGGNQGVCTIQIDSTNKVCNSFQTPLGGSYGYVKSFSVSPSGGSVVFAEGINSMSADGTTNTYQEGLYMVNTDGTGIHQIVQPSTSVNFWQVVWSPDGTKLAYESTAPNVPASLHTMNVDGSNDTVIVGQSVQGSNTYILSNTLFWPAQVPGQTPTPIPAAGVVIPHRNGGLWTLIPTSTPSNYYASSSYAVSPLDGKQVVYINQNVGDTAYSFNSMLMNVTGIKTGLATLPGSSWNVAGWSPDGQWIALTKQTDNLHEAWLIHPDGTGLRRVFGTPYDISRSLSWAADSSHLLYATADGTNANLCTTDLTNAAATCKVVTADTLPTNGSYAASDPLLTASPDGMTVLLGLNNLLTTSNGAIVTGYTLYKVNADGSGVTKLQQQSGVQLLNLAYAPDGTKIALEQAVVSSGGGNDVVYTANPDGTGQVVTSDYTSYGSYKPVWQPLPLTVKKVAGDYTGSGLASVVGTYNGGNQWYLDNYNYNNYNYNVAFGHGPYGPSGDIPVPADYNGDGKTDVTVWRPANGTWYVRGGATTQFGQSGDIPVPGNYLSATGAVNLAVWRPANGTWYVRGGATTQFGTYGDIPVPADYNGDGKTDLAVFRPSNHTFYMLLAGKTVAKALGGIGDAPMPGDYDGSGHAEVAIYRSSNSTFYYINKAGATVGVQVGKKGDTPAPADYDGNGTIDPAVLDSAGLLVAGQPSPAVSFVNNTWLYPYPVYNLASASSGVGSAAATIAVNSAADRQLVPTPAYYGASDVASQGVSILASAGGTYNLTFTINGAVVLISNKGYHWQFQATTGSSHKYKFILNKVGNLYVLDTTLNKVIWQTNTANRGVKNLTLTTTGDLVLYGTSNKVIWHTGTTATSYKP